MSDWLTIWVQPKATIRRVVAENPCRALWFLAAVYGFSSLLNLFQSLSLGLVFNKIELFLIALVLSPFWGYCVFAFWSWAVSFTGRWLKGRGNFKVVRAAYAWSNVPLIIGDGIWILLIVLFGSALFTTPTPDSVVLSDFSVLLSLLTLFKVVLSVWGIVIYVNALAEVQQFSVLRAIGNILVATFLVLVIMVILWTIAIYLLGAPGVMPQAVSAKGLFWGL